MHVSISGKGVVPEFRVQFSIVVGVCADSRAGDGCGHTLHGHAMWCVRLLDDVDVHAARCVCYLGSLLFGRSVSARRSSTVSPLNDF